MIYEIGISRGMRQVVFWCKKYWGYKFDNDYLACRQLHIVYPMIESDIYASDRCNTQKCYIFDTDIEEIIEEFPS